MFSISTKSFLISVSFYPINATSPAYANIFNYSLPIFIPLGTVVVLCITFCNVKLNNSGDKGYPVAGLFYLKKKKVDNVPHILTALLVP